MVSAAQAVGLERRRRAETPKLGYRPPAQPLEGNASTVQSAEGYAAKGFCVSPGCFVSWVHRTDQIPSWLARLNMG